MAITQRAAGTWAIVVADAAVAIPAGSTTTDRMFVLAAWKAFGTTAQITAPAGWTEVTEFADGVVAAAANVGSVKVGAWYKDHTGSESNPTVDFSVAPAPAAVVIVTFQKGGSETWDAPAFATAAMTNWTTTSQTVTASSNPGITAGDLLIGLIGIRDDTALMTRPTTGLNATGITWTGNYVESPATHASTTTSNDIAADAGYRIASSGTASAAPTMTGTISAAETGAGLWIRQRVSAGPTTVLPGLLGGYTLSSPTVQPGGVAVSPPTIVQLGIAYNEMTPHQQVQAPLISQLGVALEPAPFQFIIFFNPVVASGVVFAPTINPSLVMPLISGSLGGASLPLLLGIGGRPSSQVFTPAVGTPTQAVHPGLLGGSTLFAPSFSIQSDPQTLSLPRIGGVFDPAIFDPALFDVGSLIFAPTVAQSVTVQPALLGGGTLFDPALSQSVTVTIPLIDQTAVTFAPVATVTGVQVYPDLLGGYVLYQPGNVPGGISLTLNLINQTAVTFAPAVVAGGLTVSPGLIDRTAVLYGMAVLSGAVLVVPGIIGPTGFVYAPQVNLAGFVPPLISQLGVTFAPTITGGSIVIAGLVPIAMGTNLDPRAGSGDSHRPPVGAGSNLNPER